jgi:long-subunit fatty acid transport protein
MPEPQVRTNNPHEWAVVVNASGGVLTGKTAHEDRVAAPMDIEEQTDEKSQARNANTDFYPQGDSDWNHHIPIRLGLSVQYQLNDHLALTSGISYTYLYSEWGKAFLKGGGYEQMLHYIGVPLGVAWKLWSSKHFHFYLSGTVLLEKCISFKYRWQESQTVNSVRPWQFSVRAAFGAEYAFTPQFGIYFEPSLGYYFNDGSSLRHYYKERPFAPSLDFGLRLHLK